MALDASRSTIPAQRTGSSIALAPHPRAPADRARCTDPKPGRRLTTRHPTLNRGAHPIPQAHRQHLEVVGDDLQAGPGSGGLASVEIVDGVGDEGREVAQAAMGWFLLHVTSGCWEAPWQARPKDQPDMDKKR